MVDFTQQFFERWFPLKIRQEMSPTYASVADVRWFPAFDRSVAGVAQSYPFVVRCWPNFEKLTTKEVLPLTGASVDKTLLWGFDGLVVEIVEHGVGKLAQETFTFDRFLDRRPERIHPEWQRFFIQASEPPVWLPPRWHGHEPLHIRALLDPVEAYIALWLSGHAASPVAIATAMKETP